MRLFILEDIIFEMFVFPEAFKINFLTISF